MMQRIIGPLPDWAERTNPILSYYLRTRSGASRRARLARALGVVLVIGALFVGGYAYATNLFQDPPGQNLTEIANEVLFFPLVFLQAFMGIVALAYTVGVVGEEQRRITWDNLRATPDGAGLTLRTRWAAVFYRLRVILVVVTVLRLLLVLGVLRDLTAFQGRYLDLLIGGAAPALPVELGGVPFAVPVAAFMLSLFLTAAVLLPFTMVAFDAAVGLWLSTRFHQRVYTLVIQFLLIVLRLAIVGGLIWAAFQFVDNNLNLAWDAAPWLPLEWLTLFAFSAFADLGVRFLHLGFAGEIWVLVPYSLFIGPGLLLFMLVQAFLANVILKQAVRNAEKRG
jgi:hypothetical protein